MCTKIRYSTFHIYVTLQKRFYKKIGHLHDHIISLSFSHLVNEKTPKYLYITCQFLDYMLANHALYITNENNKNKKENIINKSK